MPPIPSRRARFPAAVLGLAAIGLAGCIDLGYQELPADAAEAEAYAPFVADLIDARGRTEWAWVRGRAQGETDGDLANGDEEAVLVTFQTGTPAEPGPIRRVALLACRAPQRTTFGPSTAAALTMSADPAHPDAPHATIAPAPGAEPILLARHMIYDPETAPVVPTAPTGVPAPVLTPTDFTDVRVVVARPDQRRRRGLIAVTLSRRAGDGFDDGYVAFHDIYALDRLPPPPADDRAPDAYRLTPAFSTLAFQRVPRLYVRDINRDGFNDIVVENRVLPAWYREIEDIREPTWPVVWLGDEHGVFAHLDVHDPRRREVHPRHYTRLREVWYQGYAEAMAQGVAPSKLAYFQYFLGRQYQYEDKYNMARRRLNEAIGGVEDATLKALVEQARANLP